MGELGSSTAASIVGINGPAAATLGNPPLSESSPCPPAAGSAGPSWIAPSDSPSGSPRSAVAASSSGEVEGAIAGGRAVRPAEEQLAWVVVPDWPEPADLDD